MTGAENERLAVLESEVAHIRADVSEIKGDIKRIAANQNSAALALAAKSASDVAIAAARSSTGQWVRFFTERFVAIVAIVISVLSWLKG